MAKAKMSNDCFEQLKKIIKRHVTPMYFNTGSPVLCIVNSEVNVMIKEIEKELVNK